MIVRTSRILSPGNRSQGKDFFSPRPYGVFLRVAGLQKARLFGKPRALPLKRIDGTPRRTQPPEPRQERLRAHILGRGGADNSLELLRVKEKYGMSCVSRADCHDEGKHIAPAHGCANAFVPPRRYTIQMRNNDSWEGCTGVPRTCGE
jgi:hypothetical protein